MIIKKAIVNAKQFPINSLNYLGDRIGFWGTVKEVNPNLNTVTVLSDTGITYRGVQVACNTWVNTDDNNEYITGKRDLPTINSRVFVLTPTKLPSSAFVLCSGFARGETNTGEFYSNNESEVEKKSNESLEVTPSGWKKTEDYKTGNLSMKSQDDKIQISINQVEDKQNNIEKQVQITAWNTSITIKEDGITFNSTKPLNIITDDKLTLTGKSGIDITAENQNVTMKCKKFSINDNGATSDFSVGS